MTNNQGLMPTVEELYQLIKGGESQSLELKVNAPWPNELAERVCGMANSREGGFIVFGVEDAKQNPVGVANPNATIDIIHRAVGLVKPTLVLVDTNPIIYDLNGAKLVVLQVPANHGELYMAVRTFWIRKGTYTVAMTKEEVEQRLNTHGSMPWEKQICSKATLADFDTTLVERYLSYRAERSRRNLRYVTAQELLVGLDCATLDPLTGDLRPTNVGILMFGYDPQLFIPQSEVVCIQYTDQLGIGKYADRKNFLGNLPELVNKTSEFLQFHTHAAAQVIGFRRAEMPEYPLEALREAVVNAVCHRDYSIVGESIRVFIYPDRVEVHSPGQLMAGITVQQLTSLNLGSKPRNPLIAQFMRDIPGYAEKVGMGIRLMVSEMRQLGLSEPRFTETHEFTVYFSNGLTQEEGDIGKLNPRQLIAIQLIREKGSLNNGEYRTATGSTETTAYRDLNELAQRGILVTKGKKRSLRYYLS